MIGYNSMLSQVAIVEMLPTFHNSSFILSYPFNNILFHAIQGNREVKRKNGGFFIVGDGGVYYASPCMA